MRLALVVELAPFYGAAASALLVADPFLTLATFAGLALVLELVDGLAWRVLERRGRR